MRRGRPRPIIARGLFSALIGAGALAVALPAGASTTKPPKPVVLLKNVSYYTVNNGSTFCRYTTPQSSVPLVGGGTASQSRRHPTRGALTLSIKGATGYADDGFYEPLGTLGNLAGYVIKAKAALGSNLWFDTNRGNDTAANGEFFSWSGSCMSSTDGDVYGLGPASTQSGKKQVEKVTDSSTFDLTCNGVYGAITLAQLKLGYCSGIDGSTPVALWAGITAGSGGSLSTKIVNGKTTKPPRPVPVLKNVAYYTVNNGSTFCRYTTPQSSVPLVGGGTASQSRRHPTRGALTLSINGATGYADNGFYEPLGTLRHLAGYVIKASASFGSNLWFDTNRANDTAANGEFFSWSGSCMSSTDGDVYGLGPASTKSRKKQVEKVTDSSTFDLTCNGVYGAITLAQLKLGYCSGIDGSTPVALWAGITAGSGGSLSTKIGRARTSTD